MVTFRKIAVGVSGGVDSAVTAYLLKSKGYNVHCVFMKNWDLIDEIGTCSAEKDYEDAQIVCNKLKLPLSRVNFVKQYWNEVFSHLIKDYETGYTPNPDILCNRNVKFKSFYKYCRETLHADAIATGHYANTSFGPYLENYKSNQNVRLLIPHDKFKDQTFFLSQVEQEPLRRTMFPLALLKKTEVRRIAKEKGLLNVAGKRDSVGICFVGKRQFKDFISEYIPSKDGPFIDIDTGKTLKNHNGIHHWTIGQGCRIGGVKQPYFIVKKDVENNCIYIAGGTNHPSLNISLCMTEKPHWICDDPFNLTSNPVFDCYFRFQHTHPSIKCSLMKSSNGLIVKLNESVRAITPGQFAVFLNDDECFGSARIINLGPSLYFLNYSQLKN